MAPSVYGTIDSRKKPRPFLLSIDKALSTFISAKAGWQQVERISKRAITGLLIKAAIEALEKCYQPGHGYMKGSIMLFDLQKQGTRQLTLMEAAVEPERLRQNRLMQTLDAINDKYGRGTLRYLSQGPVKADWHMTQDLLSGAFTTKWTQLARVKC